MHPCSQLLRTGNRSSYLLLSLPKTRIQTVAKEEKVFRFHITRSLIRHVESSFYHYWFSYLLCCSLAGVQRIQVKISKIFSAQYMKTTFTKATVFDITTVESHELVQRNRSYVIFNAGSYTAEQGTSRTVK